MFDQIFWVLEGKRSNHSYEPKNHGHVDLPVSIQYPTRIEHLHFLSIQSPANFDAILFDGFDFTEPVLGQDPSCLSATYTNDPVVVLDSFGLGRLCQRNANLTPAHPERKAKEF